MRRIVGLAVVCVALASGQIAQAIPITFNINFAGSGTIPMGSLTLDSDDIDPLMTVLFSTMLTAPIYTFDDTVSVWTNDDSLFFDPTVTFDASGVPTGLALSVVDDVNPSGDGRLLTLFANSSWRSTEAGASNTGTYSSAGAGTGPGPIPVPEPTTLSLLAAGLLGLGVMRRRPRTA